MNDKKKHLKIIVKLKRNLLIKIIILFEKKWNEKMLKLKIRTNRPTTTAFAHNRFKNTTFTITGLFLHVLVGDPTNVEIFYILGPSTRQPSTPELIGFDNAANLPPSRRQVFATIAKKRFVDHLTARRGWVRRHQMFDILFVHVCFYLPVVRKVNGVGLLVVVVVGDLSPHSGAALPHCCGV